MMLNLATFALAIPGAIANTVDQVQKVRKKLAKKRGRMQKPAFSDSYPVWSKALSLVMIVALIVGFRMVLSPPAVKLAILSPTSAPANPGPQLPQSKPHNPVPQTTPQQIQKKPETKPHKHQDASTPTVLPVVAPLSATTAQPQTPVDCGSMTGNCGSGGGSQTFNQYGAPKLVMTEDQRMAIRDAMKPFAGITIDIECQDATEDSFEYCKKLARAFTESGITSIGPTAGTHLMSDSHAIPSGVSFSAGHEREGAAIALAKAMIESHLIDYQVKDWVNMQDNQAFMVIIAPNR
jgi:hypothetical protein